MVESDYKKPPQSIESEMAVIGSVLKKNDVLDQIINIVKPRDFYDGRNKIIYDVCLEMYRKDIKIDINTLQVKLSDKNILDEIGGMEYLTEISLSSFYTTNVDQYAKTIKEKSLLRQLISASEDIMEKSYLQKEDISKIVENAENEIFEITQQSNNKGLVRVADVMQETLTKLNELANNQGRITGVSTGIGTIDKALSGLQSSELILLAARPAMGKTALGLSIAWNAAQIGKRVAFFSLEMSRYQLTQRLLAMVSMVDLKNVITGNIEDSNWSYIIDAAKEIRSKDLFVDETAGISLSELRSKAKRMKAEHGLDLIVIDYLQLMTVENRTENRQQEIATISRGLKALSKELDCPVLSLAQLSREADKRSDHKPILSDLRESGAIEQDADVVMLLYREDYYDEQKDPDRAQVIIAKHRNGPTGMIKLFFDKRITTFRDLTNEEEQQ
ncbi:MAG: replicative DNA helicase [Tissierellia bacterium]|nr:replicative DNA helicase [Tissierellia bacterium]